MPEDNTVWSDKGYDLFIELLYKMSIALEYDFDKVSLKRRAYSPVANGDEVDDLYLILKKLVELLEGDIALPMEIIPSEPNEDQQKTPGCTK
jgi:hypothetical protein